MVNKPVTYMDHNNSLKPKQVEKINSMLKTTYNKFVDQTFQKQLKEDRGETAVNAKAVRVFNLQSFEYNGTGFSSFQLLLLGYEEGYDYPVLSTNHEIKEGSIKAGGSSYTQLYDSIADYGYFFGSGNTLYFHLDTLPDAILYPYVNVTWRYKDD